MSVGGSVEGIHATAQTWGGHSQTAGAQAGQVVLAAEAMPPSVMIGPWADRARSFADQVRAGYSAVQEAYDRVASMLHVVAHAVEAAQQAEKAMHRAKEAMARAKQAWQLAHDQLEIVIRLAASGPGWDHEMAIWSQRCAALRPPFDQATQAYQAAERRFETANQDRQQTLARFARLCEDEALIVERAIPTAPVGNFVDVAAVDQLHRDATALLDLPVLATSGFASRHLAAVTRALHSTDAASLDGWSAGVLRRAAPPAKVSHSGSIFDDVAHFVAKEASHFAEGVWGGTVDFAKGFVDLSELVGHPKLLVADLKAAATHPGRLVSAVFNWQLLEKDPAKWAGALIPTIVFAAVTDGTGTVADGAADTALDATVSGIKDGGADLATAFKSLKDTAQKLDLAKIAFGAGGGKVGAAEVEQAVLLYRSKELLDAANRVSRAGDLAGALQGLGSGDDGGPGEWAGSLGEGFGGGFGEGLAGAG